SSKSRSCTSCATNPATKSAPEAHWDNHQRRWETHSSTTETVCASRQCWHSRSFSTSARAAISGSTDVMASILTRPTKSARVPQSGVARWHARSLSVTTTGQPSLEVVALQPADAENAQAGGADRLHVFRLVGDDMRSMEPASVSAILRATDLPVRVTLRLS